MTARQLLHLHLNTFCRCHPAHQVGVQALAARVGGSEILQMVPVIFPRYQRARRRERPDAIVVMALTSKSIAEVVDERKKTPPLRLDLGECASTDIFARNIARLKRLHGIADSDRVGSQIVQYS